MKFVVVLTYLTSPYQVELFDAIHDASEIDLLVIYIHAKSPDRKWGVRHIRHRHLILEDEIVRVHEAMALIDRADMVVFNFYNNSIAKKLLFYRFRSGRPWCFWGERPGFRNCGSMGRLYRRWRLSALHKSSMAIWGIGQFALDQYKREFGLDRKYFNVSYYSDLSRFSRIHRIGRIKEGETTFLYSGSLIRRKGVDLLASAFLRLAREFPGVRLRFLGAGDLEDPLRRQLSAVAERVVFVGFRDWDDLPFEYAKADVLCVPSRHDGWALVVPEGLASGLPVIASDRVGAAIDLLEHGGESWLFRAGDAGALYSVMRATAMLSNSEWEVQSRLAVMRVVDQTLAVGARKWLNAAHCSF